MKKCINILLLSMLTVHCTRYRLTFKEGKDHVVLYYWLRSNVAIENRGICASMHVGTGSNMWLVVIHDGPMAAFKRQTDAEN